MSTNHGENALTRRPKEEITVNHDGPVLTRDCLERRKTMVERINSVKTRIAIVMWMVGISLTVGGAAIAYAISEVKTANSSADDLRVKLHSIIASNLEFKERVVKAMDEVRNETRAGDIRINNSIQELQSGQQRILEIMIKPGKAGRDEKADKVS
ncbi:MAG: hypothetical protein WC998_07620 [Candidatus Paceibacterota bacterium]|jgi:hypothetical protein